MLSLAHRRRPVAPRRPGARRPRLTGRVIWDLAVCMVGLGLVVGAVFPPFVQVLGVEVDHDAMPHLRAACLAAGALLGAANFALCRVVVGGRLRDLAERLRAVAASVGPGGHGERTASTTDRIRVDSDDELGDTARAFNDLLDALEHGEHFRSLVRNASDVITVLDAEGTITYQTPSVQDVLGYRPDALLGAPMRDVLHAEDLPAFAAFLAAVTAGDPLATSVRSRMRHRSAGWRWVETVANDLRDDAAVGGLVLMTRDVEDRTELEERLRAQAFRDPLTALPNRALFMERLHAAEGAQRGAGRPFAVLFVDLDDLKTVNDTFGHGHGDTLLRAVAERLVEASDPGDVVARLAGDEFAVLLEGDDAAERAGRVAADVQAALRAPVALGRAVARAGASIGVATSQTCGEGGIGVLRAADLAMYAAKTAGKGRTQTFLPQHHREQLEREGLRADLHRALDDRALHLHYQPIVELPTGRITGYEALVRWQHPTLGAVPPSRFVPLAEDSGLVVPLGRWVLREALAQARRWADAGADLGMSVNVSARQVTHPSLVADVADALRDAGIAPGRLTLEITESLLVQDTPEIADTLARLKALGVRLALDDFGTGYSSLSYLRRFPIDVLKMDKSFVDGVATSAEDRALAQAIIRLGRTLGLEVVAEGLEHADQVAVVEGLDCPLGQGYRFAEPLPAALVPHLSGAVLGRGAGVVAAA
ncbi:putative bifunctional diguanylate cyclase/phosphodiesterase [Cellulomonas endophytica]|uniref:putative bifunctional diguanylate cyclase/phosphodiesterase n=1 Tax=Cellulomonas endophytica TaxID=2494735 RepID=UPI00101376E9|nr:EAL domain-containing protein [Cellulomonas endophytica]